MEQFYFFQKWEEKEQQKKMTWEIDRQDNSSNNRERGTGDWRHGKIWINCPVFHVQTFSLITVIIKILSLWLTEIKRWHLVLKWSIENIFFFVCVLGFKRDGESHDSLQNNCVSVLFPPFFFFWREKGVGGEIFLRSISLRMECSGRRRS